MKRSLSGGIFGIGTSRKKLREKAVKAIDQLLDNALVELVELLDELNLNSTSATEADNALIEQFIKDEREVLHDRYPGSLHYEIRNCGE